MPPQDEWQTVTRSSPRGGIHTYIKQEFVNRAIKESGIKNAESLEMRVVHYEGCMDSVKLLLEFRSKKL